MSEQWRPVVGYGGFYEVSDRGRVRSVDRRVQSNLPGKTRFAKGQILTPNPLAKTGHLLVRLNRQGTCRDRLVHHLVLEAFVGPCPPGLEGCHRNDISSDNRLANLRWDTRSANQLDSVVNRRHPNTRKTHCPKLHPYDLEIGRKNGRTYRACSKCRREHRDAFNARQRAA